MTFRFEDASPEQLQRLLKLVDRIGRDTIALDAWYEWTFDRYGISSERWFEETLRGWEKERKVY